MKNLALALIALLVPSLALSQETYSIPATAPQVTRLTRAVFVSNGTTCLRLSQIITCTQAQACTAAAAVGGASCTAAQARTANARIYPQTLAGREEFLIYGIIARGVNDTVNNAVALDQQQFCTLFKAASVANQNSACTAIGYTAGCEPCP